MLRTTAKRLFAAAACVTTMGAVLAGTPIAPVSDAFALACPSGSRYATTGDVKNSFTPAVVVHINWCFNPVSHKVTAHEWYRNAISGNGWNFHSWAAPARSGGNGLSFFKLDQTGYFWGGRWLCAANAVSVNGYGNWGRERNSWLYC